MKAENKVVPIKERKSQIAMLNLVSTDDNVRSQVLSESIPYFEEIKDELWLDELDLTKKGLIKPSLANISLVLENDPQLKGAIAYNDFREELVRKAGTPWCECKNPVNGEPWRNEDDVQVKKFLEVNYKLSPQIARFTDAVSIAGYNNRFHPIKDYLESLKWDEKPRLDSLLTRYLGVVDNDYTSAVSRKILCAAVARIFEPGVKFDFVLILEGKQGKGKSTFIKTLGRHWFGDNISSFKGKDAVEGMQGVWIMELSELQAFGKAEIEHVKSFISRAEDRMRPAYARRVETFKRRCIFIGTTNDTEYLKDETGNRRFWPVQCEIEKINISALEKEVDQLWAEAVAMWQKGEKLYLDKTEQEVIAQEEQSSRYADDVWKERIEHWLEIPVPENHYKCELSGIEYVEFVERDRTFIEEILSDCLLISSSNFKTAEGNRVRKIMKRIDGWSDTTKNMRFGEEGRQRKCYYRSPNVTP
jgi:putative DNA primase/helicase